VVETVSSARRKPQSVFGQLAGYEDVNDAESCGATRHALGGWGALRPRARKDIGDQRIAEQDMRRRNIIFTKTALLVAIASVLALARVADAAWAVGSTLETKDWDSGKTDDLSAPEDITCYTTYSPSHLLTGLRAFRDAGSADNFIARLAGECSGYVDSNDVFQRDHTHDADLIFSANWKDPGEWTRVAEQDYSAGVYLELDVFGDYVKTIRFMTVTIKPPGNVLGSYANPRLTTAVGATGGVPIGPLKPLLCPDAHVLTGVSLRYDHSKGKIRTFKVLCRPLQDN
jgi:hypothetical protein